MFNIPDSLIPSLKDILKQLENGTLCIKKTTVFRICKRFDCTQCSLRPSLKSDTYRYRHDCISWRISDWLFKDSSDAELYRIITEAIAELEERSNA